VQLELGIFDGLITWGITLCVSHVTFSSKRLSQLFIDHQSSSTMPPSKAPKKLSAEKMRIAELEQRIAEQSKTIGALVLLYR